MARARTVADLPVMPASPSHAQRRSWLASFLMVFGGLWLLALLTYDSRDPSLDTATGQSPANLAGYAGAILADMMIQGVGLAGLLPGVAAITNSWRLLIGRGKPRLFMRTLAAFAAMLPAAALLTVAGPRDWPAAIGSGGVAGLIIAGRTAAIMAPFGVAGGFVAMVFGAALACALALLALGLTASDWRRLGSSSARAARRAAEGAAKSAETLASQMTARIRVSPSQRLAVSSRDPEPATERRRFWWRERPEVPEEAPPPDTVVRITPEVTSPRAPRPDAPPPVVAARPPRIAPKKGSFAARQETLPLTEEAWRPPSLSLLTPAPVRAQTGPSHEALQANARLLETVLSDYGVQGTIVEIRPGPVVTLYELEPAPGIRSARVIGLADDVARSLSVTAVRIATVSGRNVIGIEVPNARRETVYLSELLGNDDWSKNAGRLTLALGKDIGGEPVMADLSRMPHLMIAGTTGSGKSVGVNAMILSLLFRLSPEQCRLILIDPKMLELSVYDGIPHLMTPVVTEPKKAVTALKWTVREMERRYRAMSQLGVRNIGGFNDRVAEARAKGEVVTRRVQTGFDADTHRPIFEEQPLALEALPLIVVVVDEMADLMMVAGKEIEQAVQRLAQMARAAGIHVVMATQRPSVDVITGTIKANFPTRISFQVISKFDSRTILGEQGAEQLLGMGDMLYMVGGGRITRVHGPFVTDREVEDVVAYLRSQGEPDYLEAVTDADEGDAEAALSGIAGGTDGEKTLFDQAVEIVSREGKASTSFIQRHLAIGYNRAAKLIEQMEREGVISPANHVGRREVLVRRTGDDG